MRVLSFDPGKTNFSYAVLDETGVRTFGFLEHCLTDLTADLPTQVAELGGEFQGLIKKHSPDFIVAERFMDRGLKGMGAVSEFVNISLGVLLSVAAPLEVQLISSALWKGYMTRQYWKPREGKMEGRDILENGTKIYPGGRRKRLTTHEADAILIGCWALEERTKTGLVQQIKIT